MAASGPPQISELQRFFGLVGDECSCPVCLEEFEEPKCLPGCAHNVCRRCLELLTAKNSDEIECPVCRDESLLPFDGVSALPTNHLLVRLIEHTPARKEKRVIKEALRKCKEKVEVIEKHFKEVETCYEHARTRGDELKREISSTAENLVKMIREQEKELISQVDSVLYDKYNMNEFQTRREEVKELMEKITNCSHDTEEFLQRGDVDKILASKDELVAKLEGFSEATELRMSEILTVPRRFDLKYTRQEKFAKILEEALGILSHETKEAPRKLPPCYVDYTNCGNVIQTVRSDDVAESVFCPFAITVSSVSGDVATLDEESKRVYVFNHSGGYCSSFSISYGDLWDIAFSKDDEVIVVSREDNRLLHYDREGRLLEKCFEASNRNFKFTTLSVDKGGRLILTSRPMQDDETGVECCVLVYSADQQFQFSFGHDQLSCPEGAVYHNEEFFVTDSDKKCVVVFDNCGQYLSEFGNGDFADPVGITIDDINDNVLVCDNENSMIYVMKPRGTLVTKFPTPGGDPMRIALSKDGKNIVVSFYDNTYFQVISYIEQTL